MKISTTKHEGYYIATSKHGSIGMYGCGDTRYAARKDLESQIRGEREDRIHNDAEERRIDRICYGGGR